MQVKRKAELSLLIVSRHTAPNDKVQIDCGRGPGILNVHEIADLSYHLSSDLLLWLACNVSRINCFLVFKLMLIEVKKLSFSLPIVCRFS